MAGNASPQLRLQQQMDCFMEVKARPALELWEKRGWNEEPGTDADEAPLKYLALVFLDAIEERAVRFSIEKDHGVRVFGDTTYDLPKAPSMFIARGLEILREITGLEVPKGQATLSLGIRGDTLDVIVQKEGGTHMINIPGIAEMPR
ncbi:MAG: hypothetical protein LDL33_06110 [Desulfomonile sp.]|nr:hypothetical protein [Desulfomonile sp.]